MSDSDSIVSRRDSLEEFKDNGLVVEGPPTALEKFYDYEPYVHTITAFLRCLQGQDPISIPENIRISTLTLCEVVGTILSISATFSINATKSFTSSGVEVMQTFGFAATTRVTYFNL